MSLVGVRGSSRLGRQRSRLLHVALQAAGRGWWVFPLRPNDKRPAFPDHGEDRCVHPGSGQRRDPRCRAAGAHVGWQERATTDTDRIHRAWTAAPYNVGIACGPSGLLVVDLDTAKPGQPRPVQWQIEDVTINGGADVFALLCEGANQPVPLDTYTVTTGRGGTHLYYRQPEHDGDPLRNSTGALGWLIDTRGHGGYVVAAGSTVHTGTYTIAWDTDPAPLPRWLADRLTPPPRPVEQPVTITTGAGQAHAYLDKAIASSLAAIARAQDGTLNTTLWGAAVALGQLVAGGALDAGHVRELLLNAATAKGHPAAGANRTITSGLRAGTNRPRSVAA